MAFISGEQTQTESKLPCRTPHKFFYMQNLFPGFTSPEQQFADNCRGFEEGILDDIGFMDPIWRKPIKMGPLTPEKVLGFELLFATPGVKDAAEVAGHLLLRIKLDNNPYLVNSSLPNPQDLVIGFLANTEPQFGNNEKRPADLLDVYKCEGSESGEPEFNPLAATEQAVKGLLGGYLTTMERNTLFNTIKRYTLDEDRTLVRYKLNVNETQKINLLKRIHVAKKNYRENYYFFDRNCASVLFTILGEGLQDEEIASFENIIMPPNALLSQLHRRGWIEPIATPFFSHKLQAAMAIAEIHRLYSAIEKKHIKVVWPDISDFNSQDESLRSKAFFQLLLIAKAFPMVKKQTARIAALAPYAELWYLDKKQACENYTSTTVRDLRKAQSRGLMNTDSEFKLASLHAGAMLKPQLLKTPKGSNYSGLNQVSLGVARENEDSAAVFGLQLFGQEFSPYTAHPMQRATEVGLGTFRFAIHERDSEQSLNWQAEALRLRKFKERVHRVPSVFGHMPDWGFGVSLLSFERRNTDNITNYEYGSAEILGNLFSSSGHRSYIFAGFGAAVGRYSYTNLYDNTGLSPAISLQGQYMPLRGDSLRMTVKIKRKRTYFDKFENHGLSQKFAISRNLSNTPWLNIGYEFNRNLNFNKDYYYDRSQHLMNIRARTF
jgi:hypothetical protein